jgi:hypothetical protein
VSFLTHKALSLEIRVLSKDLSSWMCRHTDTFLSSQQVECCLQRMLGLVKDIGIKVSVQSLWCTFSFHVFTVVRCRWHVSNLNTVLREEESWCRWLLLSFESVDGDSYLGLGYLQFSLVCNVICMKECWVSAYICCYDVFEGHQMIVMWLLPFVKQTRWSTLSSRPREDLWEPHWLL